MLHIFVWILAAFILLVILVTILRAAFLLHKTKQLMARSKKYERIIAGSEKTFLFLGDSTTVGTGCVDPKDSVAGRFGQAFPDVSIINEGVNGQKIGGLVKKLPSIPCKHADLLVIQIGANDIFYFTPLANIKRDLASLLDAAHRISDIVIIAHSGDLGKAPFFPPFLGWIWTRRTRKVRDIYLEESKKHSSRYVDFFAQKNDYSSDISKYYAPDLVHLTGDSYAFWFNEIVKKQTADFSAVMSVL